MSHNNNVYNKDNIKWDYNKGPDPNGYWCGGYDKKSNLSKGYHGILTQWWKHYNKGADVLLISETSVVKKEFEQQYPNLKFYTMDFFPELQTDKVDYKIDICKLKENQIDKKFDVIINQATLEHIYDPFSAMKNLCSILKPGGIIVTHTHPPGFGYHQYPRDYIRFMIDWWYDLPKHFDNSIELLQVWMYRNQQVFSCYRKL